MSTSPAATRRTLASWHAGTRGSTVAMAGVLPTLAAVEAAPDLRWLHALAPTAEDEPLYLATVEAVGASWLQVPAPGPRVIPGRAWAGAARPVVIAEITEVPA